jgi:spoIIIJ-associated protein
VNNIFEATGKTVEDALKAACEAAAVGLDEVDVEILEMGSKGFLGLGGKDAKVRIIIQKPVVETVKEDRGDNTPNHKHKQPYKEHKDNNKDKKDHDKKDKCSPRVNTIEEDSAKPFGIFKQSERDAIVFLKPIFAKMQINPSYEARVKEEILWISFSGMNLGSLIGRRGETLNALQYLTNLIINRGKAEHCRIVLDVEGYRQSREETLRLLAKKMADQAVRSGRRLELEPMNPHERRIVHLALQEDKRVDTLSYGEEPYRRVVILKKHHHKGK